VRNQHEELVVWDLRRNACSLRRGKVLGGSEEQVLGDGEHNGVVVALAMRAGFGGSVDW